MALGPGVGGRSEVIGCRSGRSTLNAGTAIRSGSYPSTTESSCGSIGYASIPQPHAVEAEDCQHVRASGAFPSTARAFGDCLERFATLQDLCRTAAGQAVGLHQRPASALAAVWRHWVLMGLLERAAWAAALASCPLGVCTAAGSLCVRQCIAGRCSW